MFTPEFFEMLMLICFGIAWPTSILKSLKMKTAKGKSFVFLAVVWAGYLCGITSKFVSGNLTYVLFFYCLNLVMVSTDIVLYFIYKHRDHLRELEAAQCGLDELPQN